MKKITTVLTFFIAVCVSVLGQVPDTVFFCAEKNLYEEAGYFGSLRLWDADSLVSVQVSVEWSDQNADVKDWWFHPNIWTFVTMYNVGPNYMNISATMTPGTMQEIADGERLLEFQFTQDPGLFWLSDIIPTEIAKPSGQYWADGAPLMEYCPPPVSDLSTREVAYCLEGDGSFHAYDLDYLNQYVVRLTYDPAETQILEAFSQTVLVDPIKFEADTAAFVSWFSLLPTDFPGDVLFNLKYTGPAPDVSDVTLKRFEKGQLLELLTNENCPVDVESALYDTGDIKVYPNPSGGRVWIEAPQRTTVTVFTIHGAVVWKGKLRRGNIHLQPGTYILTTDRPATTRKVIIKE